MSFAIIGLLLFCFSLSLFGCTRFVKNPTNQEPHEIAINNWSSELEQIKQQTLDKTCDSEMRAYYEDEIDKQSRHLNSSQLEKSMRNMQNDIICSSSRRR